ncbi:carbohydrate kinase [Hazenella coriacea]|uniref:Carbohydrate kinase n=1 Tax=Hazenella coriacea TaxID=1179467 RepID=A0A4R3L311_9BACL|nr:carbohydrate kinase [Hazenella coriacea]
MLTGMIGSLLAQRIPADQAVPMGVYLHGKAAEWASGEAHSIAAKDLLLSIGPAIQQVMTRSVQPS